MGELATLAKARQELEDLYLGVPDESVNLSFQHLTQLKQAQLEVAESKKHKMTPIDEVASKEILTAMGKSPSLDFSRAINASRPRHQHVVDEETKNASPRYAAPRGHQHHGHHHVREETHHGRHVHEETRHDHATTPRRNMHTGFRNNMDDSAAFDDISGMSVISRSTYGERGGGRRPGIPHSNICTICSTYIYIFRNRCLVCGRVYCRSCVALGMGEMTEGRKCVECLGRRFSQRYIHKAGRLGCCATGCFGRYPSMVKQQELKWAEKGPRRSRERDVHGRSVVMSTRSRSPATPRTPTRGHFNSEPNSFVMSSQYSPYTPTHPHVPY